MDDSETLTIFIGHRCSDQLIHRLFGYVNLNSMPELVVSTITHNQTYFLFIYLILQIVFNYIVYWFVSFFYIYVVTVLFK